jgi:hypothetical protein
MDIDDNRRIGGLIAVGRPGAVGALGIGVGAEGCN